MITATNILLHFGQQTVFDEISFNFHENQKIGLVGRNGSGKSTLLKAINGQLELDGGQISVANRLKIAYLPQEVVLTSNKNVLDEALATFEYLFDLKKELTDLEAQLEEEITTHHENAEHGHIIERLAFIQSELADKNFDFLVVETKKILTGLGFTQTQLEMPVDHLSGGWKMRLVLAKLLLQKADFYLFDEPTNHLDIVAKDWFFNFLKNASCGFLLVCHDKFFLDNVCDYIFELNRGNGRLFTGGYEHFLSQKEKEKIALQTAADEQQRTIKKKMETINRFRAKASKAGMAQSMLKALDKMEIIEIESDVRKIKLNFPNVKQAGRIVLKVDHVNKTFENKTLFENISFELARGDKAAIVAANGVGKTTLLNLIAGKYPIEKGTIELGYNVNYALFEQDQEKVLDKTKTIMEECENTCRTTEQRAKIRTMLGAFLFPGDDVYKKNSVLSGGEKNRVAMVKVLLEDANFLILDEPTNHLDLDSKEILLNALKQYPGTLLFVSHDRTFLDDLATKILELTPNGIVAYAGNYESYLYQKAQQEKDLLNSFVMQNQVQKSVAVDTKETFERNNEIRAKKRRLSNIESKIKSIEKEKSELLKKFETLQFGSADFDNCSNRLKELESLLKQQWEGWTKLSEELE
jgi:ATP-binding cassette subfamily F protein 3